MTRLLPRESLFLLLVTWVTLSISSEGTPHGLTKDEAHFLRDCLMTVDGQEYASTKEYFETEEAIEPCKSWRDSYPISKIVEKGLHKNFCRNPGDYTEPFCFSLNSSLNGKQSCQIPFCPQLKVYRTSSKGLEFQGKLDLKKERKCRDVCKVHQDLGPSCITDVYDKDLLLYETWIPCDVPLQHEILLLNTTYRAETIFVPLTTWYVHESDHNIHPTGSGEMLLRLPDSSGLETPPFTMKFRIRLADPHDVHLFHLNINFLPENTFEDYFNVSFSRKGLEIQKIYYESVVIEETTDSSDEKQNQTRRKHLTKIETTGRSEKIPYLMLRYDWVNFTIEFYSSRVALYHEDEEKPLLELKIPFERFGGGTWTFEERNVFQGYRTPKFVSLHSLRGTTIVTIEKVNGQYYECIEGLVKNPIKADNIHFHPMAVMPFYDTSSGSDEVQTRNGERLLQIQLINIPASLLFTSAPLYEGSNTDAKKSIIGLSIKISTKEVLIMRCGITRSVKKNMSIDCDEVKKNTFPHPISPPLQKGVVVGIILHNYILKGSSVVNISVIIGESAPIEICVLHPVYLRYWTVTKSVPLKTENSVSQSGPLGFTIIKNRCKRGSANSLMGSCLTGNDTRQYSGEISWTKTGKSCLPWLYFRNNLMALLFGDQVPESNFCRYLDENVFSLEKDEEVKVKESFWCFVSLDGEKEHCDIPHCREIASALNCTGTQEYKCRNGTPNLIWCRDRVCDEVKDPLFILDLSVPFSDDRGLRNQVFHAEKGFEFELKSYSSKLQEPLCVYLHHENAVYPIAKFRITNSSLSLSRQIVPWYDLKSLSARNSPYLNTWSYVTYIITQSEKGWNLFHQGNLYPSITYNTAYRLHQVKFSSCDSKKTGNGQRQRGQLVAVNVKSPPHANEVQEALVFSALDSEEISNDIYRFYFIRKTKQSSTIRTVSLFIMAIKTPLSIHITLYKNLPWPVTTAPAQIEITDKWLYAYGPNGSENKYAFNLKQIGLTRGFLEFKMVLNCSDSLCDVGATFGQTAVEVPDGGVGLGVFQFYGILSKRGSVKIVTMKDPLSV